MNEFFRAQWGLLTRGDRRWGAILLALIIAVGIALRFTNLDGKVVWIDEVHSFMRVGGYGKTALTEQLEQTVAATDTRPAHVMLLSDLLQFQRPPEDQNPLAGMGRTIKALATDNPQHPPVYYLAARLMVSIFGPAIATLRGTAAIFGVALIPAMGWLAWVLWRSPSISVVTMAVTAVSPFQIAYAQEAREYSLLGVMLVVTTGLLLRAMDGTRRGWWIYGGGIAVGLYTHLLMGYGIVAHGVMVLTLAGWRSPIARKFGLAIAGALGAFIPWMVAYLVYFRGIGWIGRDLGLIGLLRRWAIAWTLPIFDLQTLYNDQIFDVAAIQDLTDLGWGWGLVVMCGGLWIWCFWRLWKGSRRSAWVVTALGLVPFLMLALPDLVDSGQRSTVGRFLMPVVLAMQLAMGYALTPTPPLKRGAGGDPRTALALVLVIMLSIGSTVWQGRSPTGWNKYTSYYDPAVAEILVESDHPLIITGAEKSGRLMSIAHYLNVKKSPVDPTVLLAAKPAVPSLPKDTVQEFQTIYLYRPYSELINSLQAQGWQLQTINAPGQLIRLGLPGNAS
ncbi:MAG: glycosyltransferase family 39 protein [Cyanobacteria bacterium P01_C01_bin.89]